MNIYSIYGSQEVCLKEAPPWVLSASNGVAPSFGPGSGGWDFDIFSNKGLCLASAPAFCVPGTLCLSLLTHPHLLPLDDRTARPSQALATFISMGGRIPATRGKKKWELSQGLGLVESSQHKKNFLKGGGGDGERHSSTRGAISTAWG